MPEKPRLPDLEDLFEGSASWDFTCDSGTHSYTIRTVSSAVAKRAAAEQLGRIPAPVKAGAYYLVQEAIHGLAGHMINL